MGKLLVASACLLAVSAIVAFVLGRDPEPRVVMAGGSTNEAPDAAGSKYSGHWVMRDGVRICDGYLTRRQDQDFCEAEVPNDWVAFKFGGLTYYAAPLSGKRDR